MNPQTAEDDLGSAAPAPDQSALSDELANRETDASSRSPEAALGRRPRRRQPSVLTLVLTLALLLVTAAYIAELLESADLRAKLQRLQPSTAPAQHPAAK